MAEAAVKAHKRTTLVLGKVEVEIGLFATRAKPDAIATFETAGPNGGRLKARALAVPAPVEADAPVEERPVAKSDPLADDPGPEMTFNEERLAEIAKSPAKPETVAGVYGRELVEEGSGEVVPPENVRKGVRLDDDSFIDCTDALAQIVEETKLERIEVEFFVDATQIPRLWVQDAYYLAPSNTKAPRALRLIYEALKAERRAAIVRYTMRSRQTLGAIVAVGGTLTMLALAWPEDLRPAPTAAKRMLEAEVDEGMVDAACELVRAMSRGPHELDGMRDAALERRELLYAEATSGQQPKVRPRISKSTDDLTAALEASLAS